MGDDIHEYYDALVDTVDNENIISNNVETIRRSLVESESVRSRNGDVLGRLRANDQSLTELEIFFHRGGGWWSEDNRGVPYSPAGGGELGWLGYFIGRNNGLKILTIHAPQLQQNESIWSRGHLEFFFRGLKRNKSIQHLFLEGMEPNIIGELFPVLDLAPFVQNNSSLNKITIGSCADVDRQVASLLQFAETVQFVSFHNVWISNEIFGEVSRSLCMLPQLERLSLKNVGPRLCAEIAAFLQRNDTNLRSFELSGGMDGDSINDEGMDILVPAIASSNTLTELDFNGNQHGEITTRGWQTLLTLLESPTSNLKILNLAATALGDGEALLFARALANNNGRLKALLLEENSSLWDVNKRMTAAGRKALLTSVFDVSSFNSLMQSNHTCAVTYEICAPFR